MTPRRPRGLFVSLCCRVPAHPPTHPPGGFPAHPPTSPYATCAIALGSNVGDRPSHIAFAFDALASLPRTRLLARGPIIETQAIGAGKVDPGGPYLNSVALIDTMLNPRELLDHLHALELQRGRHRTAEWRWAPRTLDLDILTYGNRALTEHDLTIPHPRLHERLFVLEPLAAIAPNLVVPGKGKVGDLLAALAAAPVQTGTTIG
jgi:2-amino-4-hydroxy-6-hydroxymethyldihydropteridine diphosphokinase